MAIYHADPDAPVPDPPPLLSTADYQFFFDDDAILSLHASFYFTAPIFLADPDPPPLLSAEDPNRYLADDTLPVSAPFNFTASLLHANADPPVLD